MTMAEIPESFHNFRHSLATFQINTGKDVKTIQGLLRHAKASTTLDLYSQAIDASKLAAQRDIAIAITKQSGLSREIIQVTRIGHFADPSGV
jgi:integrase